MCGKGSTQTTQTTAPPPQVSQAYNSLMERAQNVSEAPYQAYTGQRVADLTPDQMQADVARFNIPFNDYLNRIGKTEDALREEFREQAKKRAKLQLTLNKIANEEKIEADKEMVEQEIKHALEHFPDAKPDLVRIHIETVLRNEKALKLLEGAEEKKEGAK
jgi:FKBP-type peptidyl-prolyl cis-trans isomerase (trigger factor)